MHIGTGGNANWTKRAIAPLAAMLLLCAGCGGGGDNNGPGTPTPVPGTPTRVPGITLFAGSASGESGSADGTGAGARFQEPSGLAIDAGGNVYVADTLNHTIRKISPAGVVSTLAGSPGAAGDADGIGTAARFARPGGLAIDTSGNLFVADSNNFRIRKISPSGLVTTVATVPIGASGGRSIAVFAPGAVAVDSAGNVYATNGLGTRKISPSGALTIVEGVDSVDGLYGSIFFMSRGITVDNTGKVYLVNLGYAISRLEPTGTLTPIAGTPDVKGAADGTGAAASFSQPIPALATDSKGNLYATDTVNQTIRKITPAGVVTTVAGRVDVSANVAGALPGGLQNPRGVALDRNDDLYVTSGNAVFKITLPAP
ncbi:MAG: hypothetical protein JWQ01_1506 [Massilia sp.]|jgi:serine/threonine-protein kinase|nr:hypothetical protein [Massilia sp.]